MPHNLLLLLLESFRSPAQVHKLVDKDGVHLTRRLQDLLLHCVMFESIFSDQTIISRRHTNNGVICIVAQSERALLTNA